MKKILEAALSRAVRVRGLLSRLVPQAAPPDKAAPPPEWYKWPIF
ncbi:MAG TPA: hypothetical protein VGR91_02120 [Stellaceae bacterium]|nr:hypothetical protein [Stellaceae bacterium]